MAKAESFHLHFAEKEGELRTATDAIPLLAAFEELLKYITKASEEYPQSVVEMSQWVIPALILPKNCNVYFGISSVEGGGEDMGIQLSALELLIRKRNEALARQKGTNENFRRITEMDIDMREGSREKNRAQRDTVEVEEVAPSIFTAKRLSDGRMRCVT